MRICYDDRERFRHDLLEGFVAQARSACQRVADLTNGLQDTMLEPRLASSDYIGRGDRCQISFNLAEERRGLGARIWGAWKPFVHIEITGDWQNATAVTAVISKPGKRGVLLGMVEVQAEKPDSVPFELGNQIMYGIAKAVADGYLNVPVLRNRVKEAQQFARS